MDPAVRELATDSGVLRTVHGQRFGAGYAAIAFAFERATLRLDCNADTDEIMARADPSPSDLPEVVDDQMLSSLVGKVIEQAWTMRNHRGFADAFQLRCLDVVNRDEVCLQFEAAAATMTLMQVTELM